MTEYVKKKELMMGIIRKIEECNLCPLHLTKTNVVPGEGSLDSPVVFVGEGPGADEDATGRPFVGRAGKLLTKILESVGLSREDVYITNIVKCRPPNNRTPTLQEMKACEPYLLSQLAVIKPKLIVCLGATALAAFLESEKVQITKYRGKLFDWHGGIKVFGMFHPSYLLRNPSTAPGSPKRLTWEDIQKVKKMYDQVINGREISLED